MKILEYDFGKVLIGENAKENWKIIDSSEEDDMWFHIKGEPSCHIVAQSKRILSENDIINVAELFHTFSKKTHHNKVIYTHIRNVKKNKNKVGSVNVINELNIQI